MKTLEQMVKESDTEWKRLRALRELTDTYNATCKRQEKLALDNSREWFLPQSVAAVRL